MRTNPGTLKKIRRMAKTYEAMIFAPIKEISPLEIFETPDHHREVPDDSYAWKPMEVPCTWGQVWWTAWFRAGIKVTEALVDRNLYVQAPLGGVETMFFVDGEERGIFSKELEVGARGNHHTLLMHPAGSAPKEYQVAFECYAGHPCVGTQPMDPRAAASVNPETFSFTARWPRLMERRDDVKDFVFDLMTLCQLVDALPESSPRRGSIVRGLVEVFRLVPQLPEEIPEAQWRTALIRARDVMAPLLACKNGQTVPFIGLTGHSHMDTAWLWTSKETIRKCARTFSNALSLMEQYPEYRFIQSSPIHAEMILDHYPNLFERIRDRVSEGRWEPNGGMYVESDGNMPAGESFVRQFLYGQAFTEKHFGYRADTFWLPDTFGYSAAFPQIMKGCGIMYFLTTKLGWNDTNRFPHDTFNWRGIDGSEVLVHFNTTHGTPDAGSLIRCGEKSIRHADASNKHLCSYGKGDGGGGPTFEEIEMTRRVEDLEGCPRSRHMSVSAFMDLLAEDREQYPVYDGELYVELHRGVLTAQHRIKRLNRKCEAALKHLELLDVLGTRLGLEPLDSDEHLSRWKVLLKNQFHDILPGTSLPEEHDEAVRAMGELLEETDHCAASRLGGLLANAEGVTVLNPFSWEEKGDLVVDPLPEGMTLGDGGNICQTIEDLEGRPRSVVAGITRPPLSISSHSLVAQSAQAESPFRMEDDVLNTPFYVVTFDGTGSMESLVDIRTGRELRGRGLPLNTFLLGEDLPNMWDNWDIDDDQSLKMHPVQDRESCVLTDGPLQFRIRQEYRLGQRSRLWQDMVFHANTARIDFETKVDWNETHSLLKAGFDVNVRATTFKSEMQFGWVERPTHRNTSYDAAKFEVCQHRWSDLSEPGYGVALLNDSKYGIGVAGSDMRLSLLKSGGHPDPRGDAGVHVFRYALYPHVSGFGAETVIRPAYAFNDAPRTQSGASDGFLPPLLTVDRPNVIVESVKQAEDGNGYILRVFEAEGTGVKCTCDFQQPVRRIEQTNMLEELESVLLENGQALNLMFAAFEVKTLRVVNAN